MTSELSSFSRGYISREATMRLLTPLIAAVSEFYIVPPKEILAYTNKRHVSVPRQVAMYLARSRHHLPYCTIALAFRRHHSTVIHAVRSMERRLPGDEYLRAEVDEVRERMDRPRPPRLSLVG